MSRFIYKNGEWRPVNESIYENAAAWIRLVEENSESFVKEFFAKKINNKDFYNVITAQLTRCVGEHFRDWSVCSALVEKGYEKPLIKFIEKFGTAFMDEKYDFENCSINEHKTLFGRCLSNKMNNVARAYCCKKLMELDAAKTKKSYVSKSREGK